MITKTQVNSIVSYLQKQPEVVLVYLFGSQAKGNNHIRKASDIDLAILFSDSRKNLFKLQGLYMEELTHTMRKKVDVVCLNASDVAFCYRVISEGKLLYQKTEEARITFQTDLIKRYFDLRPTYEEYYSELSKRAREGVIGTV